MLQLSEHETLLSNEMLVKLCKRSVEFNLHFYR